MEQDKIKESLCKEERKYFTGIVYEHPYDCVEAKRRLLPLLESGYVVKTADNDNDWPFQVMCHDGSVHFFGTYASIFAWALAMKRIIYLYDDQSVADNCT